MTVRTILNAKGSAVATAPADTLVREIVKQLTQRRIGAMVISDDGRTVDGIISERDVIRCLNQRGADTLDMRVSELMTRDVHTATLDDSVATLMSRMTEKRIRHLPVLDGGALCGIVSIGDAVKARMDEVETEAHALRDYIAGN